MVLLIPDDRLKEEFNGSIGEEQLYNAFKNLDDNYVIFHSINWMTKKSRGNQRFGESDYLVYHKDFGVICLEVKHGAIRGEKGRIYQINRKTQEKFDIDPMRQADRSKYYFIDVLTRLNKSIPIYSAVWFTGIKRNELVGNLPHNYEKQNNTFFYDDIERVDKSFKSCFSFHNMKVQLENPEKIKKEIIDIIAPKFDAFPSLSNVIEKNDFIFNRMTKEQSYLLDYLEEQDMAVIQGAAGTGKTLMAVEKAKRLSKDEKVVFLCFNSLLLESLNERYKEELHNVTFTNLHSLVSKAYNKQATDEDIMNFLSNWDDYPNDWNYKSIIVDEGQDFSNDIIEQLKEISILNEGSFYVFYDKHQLVQQRNVLEWLRNFECHLVLSFNCRNTLSIAQTSSTPLGIDKDKIKMRRRMAGDRPRYFNTQNENQLIKVLDGRIREYTDQGIRKNQIVILTAKTLEKSILSGIKKIGNYTLVNHNDSKNILFTTSRKFKGLEADVVLLIDIDSEVFSKDESRRVFYVGASRAKTRLDIFSMLDDKKYIELCRTLSKGKSDRRTNIRKYLLVDQVKI